VRALRKEVFIYFDDLIVVSDSFDSHLEVGGGVVRTDPERILIDSQTLK